MKPVFAECASSKRFNVRINQNSASARSKNIRDFTQTAPRVRQVLKHMIQYDQIVCG